MLTTVIQRGLRGVSAWIGKPLQKHAERLYGVSTVSMIGTALADDFRRYNTSLIKSLVGQQILDIRTELEKADAVGLRVEDLSARIQRRFQVTKSKANLLARDQVLKLNANIVKEKQTQAGITQYRWSTSNDERVRDIHAELDSEVSGVVYSWDDPPVISEDGRTGHPGEDYQCRCQAIPVIPRYDD